MTPSLEKTRHKLCLRYVAVEGSFLVVERVQTVDHVFQVLTLDVVSIGREIGALSTCQRYSWT